MNRTIVLYSDFGLYIHDEKRYKKTRGTTPYYCRNGAY